MKILVIKLTSMGDALHLLPALSDLQAAFPEARVDWMIEETLGEIPRWHPSVDRVIPVATRRWRSLRLQNLREFAAFIKHLRAESYDVVLDAQGLMKSAALGWFARLNHHGERIGFGAGSIKEKMAARFYHKRVEVSRQQHAIDRLRKLFAEGFAYPLPGSAPNFSINRVEKPATGGRRDDTILFLHGTTWPSKHLSERYWQELRDLVLDAGFRITLCWGNSGEKARADRLAQDFTEVEVLPKSGLDELRRAFSSCSGAIAVDTGLGHLAAALAVPTVSVYGATEAMLTGAVGESQTWLQCKYPCSPCFLKDCDKLTKKVTEPPCYQTFTPAEIWGALQQHIT